MKSNVVRLPEAATLGGQRRARSGIGTMGDVMLEHLELHGITQAGSVQRMAEHREAGDDPVGWRDCLTLAIFETLAAEQRNAVRRALVRYRYRWNGPDSGAADALAIVGPPVDGLAQ